MHIKVLCACTITANQHSVVPVTWCSLTVQSLLSNMSIKCAEGFALKCFIIMGDHFIHLNEHSSTIITLYDSN